MTTQRRVRVVVRGRVQGVAFRAHTAEAAERAGVAGWVRNRGDGSVEALFVGAPEAVDAMLDFVRRGPRFARVHAVEEHEAPAEDVSGFAIRY